MFAGLAVLAIVSAMDMTNGGLYVSLMNQYDTKEESGAFVLMSRESSPLILADKFHRYLEPVPVSVNCCRQPGHR